MDRRATDFFQAEFWCVLVIGALGLAPITSPRLRKLVWSAINLTFLVLLLGYPNPHDLLSLCQQGRIGDASAFAASSGLGMACLGVLAAWAALQAIQSRRFGLIPLVLASVVTFGLFLVRKVPSSALYGSYSVREMLTAIGLSGATEQPLRAVLVAIGFSYVALRMVEALRLTYEGRHPAPDLASTLNYLLPFHMLTAGPIQGYADFVAQPAVPPPLSASDALRGVERIAHGLFKKFVLVTLVDRAFLTGSVAPFPYVILEAWFFYLKVYLDFSGYSDIAVGAGKLMGVATPENFNRPYIARNMIDFWDRWHISLSKFIYRNLFVPVQLALMRRTGPRAVLWCATVAFTVSFMLCGLWHELNMPWAMWGAMQVVGLVVVNWYRAWLQRRLDREALERYRANRAIRVAAIVATQLYVAASHMVASWTPE